MKQLSQLTNHDFIEISKIVDNAFIGNRKIIVSPLKAGLVKITGHTDGGQCVNCEVKVDIYMDELKGVFTQNEYDDMETFRAVYPDTLRKVINYLEENNFNYMGLKPLTPNASK